MAQEGKGTREGASGSKRPINGGSVLENGLGALVNLAICAENQVPGEPPRKPSIMGYRDHRALVSGKGMLQAFCAGQVQVIGWLIQQEHGGSREFKEQDLESRLLTTTE